MRKSIYWGRFLHRLAVASRTGLAVLLVGILLIYVKAVWNVTVFPAFAPVVAVITCDETAGKVFRNFVGVVSVSIFTLCSSLAIFRFVKLPMNLALSIFCIGVSSFLVVYPTKIHLLGRKVGLAQISILYMSAHLDPTMDRLLSPPKLICSTAIGATCGVLAILIPYPRLAVSQVIKTANAATRGQSELLKTTATAFCAADASTFSSMCLHSKILTNAANEAITVLHEKEAEVWWEMKGISTRISALAHVTRRLYELHLYLTGMEIALQSGFVLLCPDVLRSTLQDPLMAVADHCSALLENSRKSMTLCSASKPDQVVELIDEGKRTLKGFDEALMTARLRAYYTPATSQLSEGGARMRAESSVWKANDISPVKGRFMARVTVYFFIFNLRLYLLEAMHLVDATFKLDTDMYRSVRLKVPELELQTAFNLPGVPEDSIERSGEGSVEVQVRSSAGADAGLTAVSSGLATTQQPESHCQSLSSQCMNCTSVSPVLGTGNRWKCLALSDRLKPLRCLKTAIAMMLAAYFGVMILPGDIHSCWAPITVSFIIGNHQGGSFRLASLRVQGTVMGSIYGYLADRATAKCSYCTLIALTIWVTLSDYIRYSKTHGYSGLVSALTASIMMLGDFQDHVKQFAMDRIAETFVGVLCLVLVETVVFPDRAVVLVRREAVSSLAQLRHCAASIVAVYTGQKCGHCRKLAIEDIQQQEQCLRGSLAKQSALRTEAVLEPELWFVPFPGDVYSNIINIQTRMIDLLFFMLCSLQATSEDSLDKHMQELLKPLVASVVALEDELLSTLDTLKKLLERPHSMGPLQTLYAFLHSIWFCSFDDGDVEKLSIPTTSHNFISIRRRTSDSSRHPLLVLGHRRRSVGGTPVQYKTTMDHFELSFESVMDKIIAESKVEREAGREVIGNSAILSVSSLSFCLHSLLRETIRLEKAMHELLQAENPQSVIDFYDKHRPSRIPVTPV